MQAYKKPEAVFAVSGDGYSDYSAVLVRVKTISPPSSVV